MVESQIIIDHQHPGFEGLAHGRVAERSVVDDGDPIFDDALSTIYGDTDSAAEASTFCLSALALTSDGRALVGDACLGFVVELTPESDDA